MKRCDLYCAWIEFCEIIAENELGVTNPNFLHYMEYKKKCLEFPVNVKVSPEVYKRKEYITVIKNIESSLKRGKGISMYLSKRAKKLKKDGMFNDFGIIHLHLNKKIGNRVVDIAKDSGTTLQVYYSQGTVYIFNFGRHGKGAYTNPKDLQKLYDRFPDALRNRLLESSNIDDVQNMSSGDIFRIRKLNGLEMTYLRGKDGSTLTIRPYLITSVTNDNGPLDLRLKNYFRNLNNSLNNDGYKSVDVEIDIEKKEFRIIDKKSNKLIFKLHNDVFINYMIY